jgi:hypothetical protein
MLRRTNGMFSSPSGLLVTFCVAVGAALAWHSYGDTASHIIARSSQWAGWLASRAAPIAYDTPDANGLGAQAAATSPDQQRLNAMSVNLDAIRQIIDRIAVTQEQMTRNIDRFTADQERMTRDVAQITIGQERMTREITKVQALEQQIRHKNSEPALRPGPAAARQPVPRVGAGPDGAVTIGSAGRLRLPRP